MMLSRLEEEQEGGANGTTRNSLKDRFKQLRMQEEAGASNLPDGEGDASGVPTPLGLIATREDGQEIEKPLPSPVPTPSSTLAPGTVSGANAGPSASSEAPVDWDLWQSVVYEGPAAVARTSAEELNRAIATGIPNAIRGVIWQVLAQSKDDDLEASYKDLVAIGTSQERDRHSSSTAASLTSNGNLSVQSGDVASSASSISSEHSAANGTATKIDSKSYESTSKTIASTASDRKRKEDVQKLEKVIKRDLGARTSYSKYAAAAGLQDGLFGVCKAYALYDEGVGYAQGMNFLIMPLLFNVS
jgi:hypothetical protein